MAAGRKTGGRVAGVPNRTTAALKDMILQALDAADPAGGIGYLTAQAAANPSAFLTLVGKVLPMQVAGDPDNPVRHVVRVELVSLDAIGADKASA